MTDSAPAAPVPGADPVPKPIVARAAEAVVAAPAAVAKWWVTLSPAINASIIAIVTAIVSISSTIATQHYIGTVTPKGSIQAADPPKAEPIRVVLQPLDKLEARAATIEAKLDTLIQQTAPKAPVVIPKRTKSAAR